MKEFKDKVLVVTGGSRGIGKAIAVEGAKRGMKIVLNDIDGDQLAKTAQKSKTWAWNASVSTRTSLSMKTSRLC